MNTKLNFYSEKQGEIKKFLECFDSKNFDIDYNNLTYEIKYRFTC